MFKEFKERVRYALDELFAREIAGQVALFLTVVGVVILIGTTAVFFGLFAVENANVASIPRDVDAGFLDALWWSSKLVLNLPGLHQTYGATWPILIYALVLSFSSLASFAILISLVRTIIRRRLESLRKGDTPVKERDHILLLSWTGKTIPVLRQIAKLRAHSRVVILAPREVIAMQESLRSAGVSRLPVKVILRSGAPSNADELIRVAANRAASVVVFSPSHDGQATGRDSEAIKTMMLLTGSVDMEGRRPTLIAEIEDPHNLELASMAGRGQFQIVASGTVISKVIVQCIRNPGLSAVYRELFEPTGNGIYIENVPAAQGRTMREMAARMPDAVPIGVTWNEAADGTQRIAAALNLEPEYELDDDDSLIVIARHPGARLAETPTAPTNNTEARAAGSGRSANTPRRVMLIGWNGELYDILAELDLHALGGAEITLLSVVPEDDAAERVAQFLDAPLKNVSLEFRTGNPVNRSAYQNLDLQDFDCIVVLADDAAEAAEVDAYTLRIVLRLSDVRGESPAVHTVVELADGMNRPLFDTLAVTDIVASADIVSAELAQTARQPVLGPVYRELLRAGGVELSVRPVSDYLPEVSRCTFADLVLAAQANLETAVAVMVGSEVLLNPPREVYQRVDDSLELVVLAQQLYR